MREKSLSRLDSYGLERRCESSSPKNSERVCIQGSKKPGSGCCHPLPDFDQTPRQPGEEMPGSHATARQYIRVGKRVDHREACFFCKLLDFIDVQEKNVTVGVGLKLNGLILGRIAALRELWEGVAEILPRRSGQHDPSARSHQGGNLSQKVVRVRNMLDDFGH